MPSWSQAIKPTAGSPQPIVLDFKVVCPAKRPLAGSEPRIDSVREVHHRVKNDLQLVASMLTLQARQSLDAYVTRELNDAAQRILAVALLHERLQHGGAQSTDVAEYLGEICSHLAVSSGCGARGVRLFFAGDSIELPGDQAMSLGLILNELVTNALKHAHHTQSGYIDIRFHALSDRLLLTVADQGSGVGEGVIENATGLGLSFVRATAAKLGGELFARNRAIGAEIGVRLPRPERSVRPI